jgi:hypothetical protein
MDDKTNTLLERIRERLEGYDTAQALDLTAEQAKNALKYFKAGKSKLTYERLIYVPKWLAVFLKNEGHSKAASLAEQLTKELTSIYRTK